MNFNPNQLLLDLDAIILAFPELAEDAELKDHVLKNGSDFHKALTICLEEMRQAETLSEAILIRAKELSERKARMDRKSDAMRSLMQKIMEHAQEKKVTLPEATLSLRPIPRSVLVFADDMIPPDYTRTKVEPDRKKIKEALEAGTEVSGAVLSNGGTTLSVRCK